MSLKEKEESLKQESNDELPKDSKRVKMMRLMAKTKQRSLKKKSLLLCLGGLARKREEDSKEAE